MILPCFLPSRPWTRIWTEFLDYDETYTYGTNSLNPDTDGDGFADGAELTYWDSYLER